MRDQRKRTNTKLSTPYTYTVLLYILIFISGVGGQCTLDSLEPNNDKGSATTVQSGNQYSSLTLCTFDDIYDWYTITYSGSGQRVFRFALTYDTAQGDITAVATNASSSQMSEIDSTDPKSIGAVLGGTYGNTAYVLLQRGTTQTSVTQTDYSLAITDGACSEDRYEPNNYVAAWIPVGTMNTGLTLCGNEFDNYQMVFLNAQDITITVVGSGSLYPNVQLFDANGNTAVIDTDGSQQTKVINYKYSQNSAGTLRIQIWPSTFQTSTGVYTLQITNANPSTTFIASPSAITGSPTESPSTVTSSKTTSVSVVATTPTGTISQSATESVIVTGINDNQVAQSKTSTNIGAIVGGVVGGVIALIVIAIIAAFLVRKSRKNSNPPAESGLRRPGAAVAAPAAAAAGVLTNSQQVKSVYHTNSLSNFAEKSDVIPWTDLELKQKIGEGSFGTVYKAKWRNSTVAVKEISQALLNTQSIDSFRKEANVMRNLRPHPNVVLFLGVTLPPDPICIVTEYLKNGSVNEYLKRNVTMAPASKLKLLLGISNGMLHLHREGIIHRDLAARNILLGSNLEPKVSDFGMARRVRGPEQVGKTYNSVGPLKWMAPESVLGNTYSQNTDVWSFGVVCYEILTGLEPYSELNAVQAAYQVIHQGMRLSFPPDTGLSSNLIRLFESCFERDPNARPTFETLCTQMESALKGMRMTSDSSTEDLNASGPSYEYQFTPSEPTSNGSVQAVNSGVPRPSS